MRTLCLLAIVATLWGLCGCSSVHSPLGALVIASVKAPLDAEGPFEPTKTGEACAQSVLGIVAFGDASIHAAKAAGGIKEIATVDYEALGILGFYAQFCTIVRGR